jgi:RND family efflux transporter MFP subunit
MKKVFLVFAIILLHLISCKEKVKPGSVEVKRAPVTGVTLASVPLQEVESYYETAGTTRARTTSVLASRTMGTVQSIEVKEGDRVRAGQQLAVLDDRDATQRVAAAESGYKEALKALDEAGQNRSLADVTYKRYRNLYDEKVISQQEMDQVETRKKVADAGYERVGEMVNRARAQLEEALINKGFTRITAPHEGIITEKRIEQGSLATPGVPLFVLEETSLFKVDAYVNERLAGKIKTGMPITILLASEGKPIVGTIGEIAPAVDPATRTFPVKIFLKDPSLRSGLYAKIRIPEGKKQTLLIPAKAVVEKGLLTGVYVVDSQGVMTYRIIKTGQTYGDQVEVVSGIRPDERIAVAGLERAIDGGLVKQ